MLRPGSLCYEFGPFRLDVPEHMLLRDGHPVPLTPKTFDVLRVLVQSGGHLVEKKTLLKEVWPDSFVEEGTLNRSVSVLRKALGDSPSGHQYIETVPTRGYRFVAPVTECLRPDSISVELHGRPAVDIEAAQSNSPTFPKRSVLAAFRVRISKRATAVVGALLILVASAYAVIGPTELRTNAPATVGPVHRQVTFTGRAGGATLSPDGRRIAYVSAGTSEKQLMVQELAGGQPLAIFSAPEVGHVRWSPDGSELMIWTRGSGRDGMYIMPQLGGTLRRIAAGQYIACWSPDGSTIAIGTYLGGKIWFLNTLGRNERTVALEGVDSPIWDIDWSPANGLLTFITSNYEGRFTVWTIRPDGSHQKKVLTADTEISSVRWGPNGDAVYFSRRQNLTFSFSRVPVSVAGGDENREDAIVTLLTGLEAEPSFALSAAGTRLVYTRAPFHSNLWLLEGGRGENQRTEPRELTHGTSLIERPSISPDGTTVVFNIGHEGLANLYLMPIEAGSPKQLTFGDSFNLGGVWSPDGKRIAFVSTQESRPRVWTVNAEGGTPRALASNDLSDSFDLTWSPATQILYQQPGNRNYYELDPETRGERLLIRHAVGWIFSPVHSPDGQKIAVAWHRRPNRGIWIIDVNDHSETPVYKTAAASAMPIGWSPDGRSIYVVEGKNSTYRGLTAPLGESLTEAKILMVPLNGGDINTVADLPFEEIGGVAMSADGRRFVITVYSSRSDVWIVDNFDRSPQ